MISLSIVLKILFEVRFWKISFLPNIWLELSSRYHCCSRLITYLDKIKSATKRKISCRLNIAVIRDRLFSGHLSQENWERIINRVVTVHIERRHSRFSRSFVQVYCSIGTINNIIFDFKSRLEVHFCGQIFLLQVSFVFRAYSVLRTEIHKINILSKYKPPRAQSYFQQTDRRI